MSFAVTEQHFQDSRGHRKLAQYLDQLGETLRYLVLDPWPEGVAVGGRVGQEARGRGAWIG
jgi:hypothetical protein